MTRINSDLNPAYLTDQVLMAEYRELPMVYAALHRSKVATRDNNLLLKKIPKTFTLNTGHVTFFYDKLLFLSKRYNRLIDELENRGYNLDKDRIYSLHSFDDIFKNDYAMTGDDKKIICARLIERYESKPTWYKYYGEPISRETFLLLLEKA